LTGDGRCHCVGHPGSRLGHCVATKIDNAHGTGLGNGTRTSPLTKRENPFRTRLLRSSHSIVKAWGKKSLLKPMENSIRIIRKQRCAVQKYMLKTLRHQKSWWQRSQGGV